MYKNGGLGKNTPFVIAPLGKVMVEADHDLSNLKLAKPDDQGFMAVPMLNEVAERVKLVSTTRGSSGSVLHSLSERVSALLDVTVTEIDARFVDAPLGKSPHVLLPYDGGSNNDIEFST